MINIVYFIFLVFVAFRVGLNAGIITADSCGRDDVQAAIDAAVDGDVVLVPAGSCVWEAPVTIGKIISWNPNIPKSKAVTLMGAGIDQTIIEGVIEAHSSFLSVMAEESKPFRITGFTFKGSRNQGACQKMIFIGGNAKNWRIDNCKFDNLSLTGDIGCGINASGVGVIDNCRFENIYTAVATLGSGDASWAQPLTLGSGSAVYIEDNIINNTHIVGDGATDAYNGARYVFRHNKITNARAGHHGLDSGGYRSPHSFEIYGNTFTWTVTNSWYTWRSRGGTGVVYNNSITGQASSSLTFGVVYYRSCCCDWCTNVEPEAYGYPCDPYTAPPLTLHTTCTKWGRCDGDNPLDGNLDPTGYPCRDQTGRTTDMDGDGIQDLAPQYEWDNAVNGKDADITVNDPWGCANPSIGDHIKENRDFYNDTVMPGYKAYSYPHPLRGETSSSAPNTPKSLVVR